MNGSPKIRIMAWLAVLCLLPLLGARAGTNYWTGAANSNWFDTNNWSGLALPAAGDAVIITNTGNNLVLTGSPPYLASFMLTNKTLTFSNWNTTLSATNVTIWNGGTVTVANAFTTNQMSNKVYIVCRDLLVEAGGQINVYGKGYLGGNGPGRSANNNNSGGAGYGGRGGVGTEGSVGAAYGVPDAPLDPGSGAGSLGGGGAGGGAIRIEAVAGVTVNGTLQANGSNGTVFATGGSGGSIYITCGTFGGNSNGLLSAVGGDKAPSSTGGGAGGGRIAVSYTNLAAERALRFSVLPSSGYLGFPTPGDGRYAAMGTIWLSDLQLCASPIVLLNGYLYSPSNTWSPGSLVVSNAFVGLSSGLQWNIAGNVLIQGASGGVFMAANSSFTCGGDLTLTNGGQFRIYSAPTNGAPDYGALLTVTGTLATCSGSWLYPYADGTNGGAPLLRVGRLLVSTNSGILADAAGFLENYGPGKSGNKNNSGGGGYGGNGGCGAEAVAGTAYGSVQVPIAAGSGAGILTYSPFGAGGYGGGVIRVEATNDVTVNGTLQANGGIGQYSAGGSGGSIYIICGTFGGSSPGLLNASGGNGNAGGGGGGGGGRIAVSYTNLAVEHAVRFSTLPGSNSLAFSTPGDQRYPSMGTIWLPDMQLWSSPITLLNGYLYSPSNSWSPASLVVSNVFVGLNSGLQCNVAGNVSIQGVSGGVFVAANSAFTCGGDLTLTNGGQFRIYSAPTNGAPDYGALLTVTGTLTTCSGSWLYPYADGTNGGAPLLRVGRLLVSTNSGILADQAGYQETYGPGKSGNKNNSGGAGYGGKGGLGGEAAGGPTNGSPEAPLAPGSGAGSLLNSPYGAGGYGGGIIRVEAGDEVIMNGTLQAKGGNGSMSGGGSGGAIHITCRAFSGNSPGLMNASGGNGNAGGGGGGGGGRIAVWVDVPRNIRNRYVNSNGADGRAVARSADWPQFAGMISVANGTGWKNPPDANAAYPGTVFFFRYVKGTMLGIGQGN